MKKQAEIQSSLSLLSSNKKQSEENDSVKDLRKC